jgi:hypothetical protein
VAELPSGVGGTPALIPANAAASIQAGDLAEIYDINPQGDWRWKTNSIHHVDNWLQQRSRGSRTPNLDDFGTPELPEM